MVNVGKAGVLGAINSSLKENAAINKLAAEIRNKLTPEIKESLTGKGLSPDQVGVYVNQCYTGESKPDLVKARTVKEAASLIYRAQAKLGKKFEMGEVDTQDGYLTVNGTFNLPRVLCSE